MSRTAFVASSFAAGFGAFAALLIAVFATGSTFGQRCAKAYPSEPAKQERCVARLERGGFAYQED